MIKCLITRVHELANFKLNYSPVGFQLTNTVHPCFGKFMGQIHHAVRKSEPEM